MPVIESEARIRASRSLVYKIAKDVESFPSFMPDVESVEVLERSDEGGTTLTRWVGLVPEFKQKIRWTEEDVWNAADFTCIFHQTEGEYQVYEGEWRFTEDGSETVFHSSLNYELEIPLIGALLKTLIAKKMRDNIDKILAAIKERAEQQATA